MHEISSQQKSFQKIFGNAKVVAITPEKEMTAQNLTRRTKDILILSEKRSGQNSSHIETFEQSSKSEQCSGQKTWSKTSKVDGDVIHAYDAQYNCNKEVTPGKNELTSRAFSGTLSGYESVYPNYRDVNYSSPSYHKLTSSFMAQSEQEKCDNKIKSDRSQHLSSEDDVELHKDNVSTEGKNTISDTKHSRRKKSRVKANSFGNHKISSADDLKLGLRAKDEGKIAQHSVSEIETNNIRSCDDLYRKGESLLERKIPKNAVEDVSRHQIDLQDDSVYDESCSESIHLKEVEGKSVPPRKIHDDGIKNIERQKRALKDDVFFSSQNIPIRNMTSKQATKSSQPLFNESSLITSDKTKNVERQKIALEDDFLLCGEDSTGTSRNMSSHQPTKYSQPLFVEGSLTSDNEMKNIGRQRITSEDDFILPSEGSRSTSGNMSTNQTTKSSQPLLVASSLTSNDEIKNVERQKIALDDDFVLPSENSTGTSRKNISSNQANKSSQPLLVESSLTANEIKSIEREKIALDDDFVLPSEDFTSTTRKNVSSNQATKSSQPLFVESSLASDDEIKNVERQTIALEDDLVLPSENSTSTSRNMSSNQATKSSQPLFVESSLASDGGIKNIGRQRITLEDDFVLPSTSRNMSSYQAKKSSQPLFVEHCLTSDEIKNSEQQKVATGDNFIRSEDSSSSKICNSSNVKEEKIASEDDSSSLEDGGNVNKGKTLSRQISRDNGHYEKLNDASSFRVNVDHPRSNTASGLQLHDKKHEVEHPKKDVINDPVYLLNAMSDIR